MTDLTVELYFSHGLNGSQSVGFGGTRQVHFLGENEPKVGGKSGAIEEYKRVAVV